MKINATIVVNHTKNSVFGCRKYCSYCNWKTSPFLPNGTYDWDKMGEFVKNSEEKFITISGGGDPLYKVMSEPEYKANLVKIIELILGYDKQVRIITREVETAKILADTWNDPRISWSFSLDPEIYRKIKALKGNFQHNYQVSMVMPKDTVKNINGKFLPWVMKVRNILKCEVVLREDINSTFKLDWDDILSIPGVMYVSRELCLGSDYFINDTVWDGHTITPDRRGIMTDVVNQGAYIFGGFLRHMYAPDVHDIYGDIDIAVPNDDVVDYLVKDNLFFIKYYQVVIEDKYKVYVLHHENDENFKIHIHVVEDPEKFISSFQLDADQVWFKDKLSINKTEYINKITTKIAVQTNIRDINPVMQEKYFKKLKKRGWTLELMKSNAVEP